MYFSEGDSFGSVWREVGWVGKVFIECIVDFFIDSGGVFIERFGS